MPAPQGFREASAKKCQTSCAGTKKNADEIRGLCGRSSVVERQLPKLYVVGSIPIARSIGQIVRPGDMGDRSYLRHG